MKNQDYESGSYMQGFTRGAIIGGLAGAIVALLFAPKSGKELRKDIAEKSNEIYGKASDMFADVEESVGTAVHNTVNEGRERAEQIISSAKRQADQLISNAETILNEAKEKAIAAKDTVQEKYTNLRDATKAGVETFKNELNNNSQS